MFKKTGKLFLLLFTFYFGFIIGGIFFEKLLYKHLSYDEIILKLDDDKLQRNIDDYFGNNIFLKRETFRIVNSLSNKQKVGLLLMPALEKNNSIEDIKKWIELYDIGGFMVLSEKISKEEIRELKTFYETKNNLPFFVSLDAEPSLMKYRAPDVEGILNTSDINSEKDSIKQAEIISDYLYKNSFNLNFAPVYDSAENKTVIGNRSFEKNISELAGLFSEVSKNSKILTTAKHFPGHGSVTGDTHLSLQVIKDDLSEIGNFKSAIESKVPFMMVGHLAIESENESIDTGGLPSTLSEKIMNGVLVRELGFEGIVITDAMNMGALNQFKDLNIRSLKAGADILLMPRNLEEAYEEILSEIQKSKEFSNLIDQKVRKIVRMKLVLDWLR